MRAKATIENLRDPNYYKGVSQKKLDEIREELRELIQYLDISSRPSVYTNIQDSDIALELREPNTVVTSYGLPYRKRVESFIRENKNHITISKLINNIPITSAELAALEQMLFDGDERGTVEAFKKEFGDEPLGVFIRSIIGLDITAAQQAFSEFLTAGNLKADQMTFIQNIITYLSVNGTIEPGMLFEAPFNDINDAGLIGVFDENDAYKIISIVEHINENAKVG